MFSGSLPRHRLEIQETMARDSIGEPTTEKAGLARLQLRGVGAKESGTTIRSAHAQAVSPIWVTPAIVAWLDSLSSLWLLQSGLTWGGSPGSPPSTGRMTSEHWCVTS